MTEVIAEETILSGIVKQRQQQISELLEHYPRAQLEAQLTPSTRSLREALLAPGSSFILECKKASPSKGLIRADFHPVSLAQTYSRYAAAISVLTEHSHFQGCFEYLTAVSQSVSQPVLCKDFITQAEHVLLARYFGADAILLMLSVLDDDSYRELAAVAERYQLDVLTEVSTAEEMQRAKALGAKIIGINNRNLRDLSIDPERSIELSKLAPKDAVLVAESGFNNHAQVRATAPFVDAFLVGSALSAQPNVDQACRELIYGPHKVCGLTRPEDAIAVRSVGAAFGGLIFVPRSKRCVNLAQARAICAAEPALTFVGVFADQPLPDVIAVLQQLNLTHVQLHGHEDATYIQDLRQALRWPLHVTRALAVTAPLILPQLKADSYLLDNGPGGTGEAFSWSLVDELTDSERRSCSLAGGLKLSNIQAARATGVAGLDINSGAELRPGIKDAGQLRLIFQQLRHYGKEQ